MVKVIKKLEKKKKCPCSHTCTREPKLCVHKKDEEECLQCMDQMVEDLFNDSRGGD
jgi:hypothetical protein